MCRIVGFWDLSSNITYDAKRVLVNMRDVLKHGGPDDAGLYVSYKHNLFLGHRRLAIIDLSERGRQPMRFQSYVIVYNGEIYNYREIKKELMNKGYRFETDTDTEVILKAFYHWGLECVKKFRGMFAFVIWDEEREKLILCRDRFGIKPLYFYYKDNLFLFSSEMKSFYEHPNFIKDINLNALSLYFKYGYIPAPFSILENAFKVKPGHFVIVNKTGEIHEEPYWSLEDVYSSALKKRKDLLKLSEEEVLNILEDSLVDSFKLRTVSDVPIGIFLSGGIDSSLVAVLLKMNTSLELKTFTMGFEEEFYNEAPIARKVASILGTEHYEFYCKKKDLYEIIPELPNIYDEPFGDSSAIPTFLLSKYTRDFVKVVLSADGGDEQFFGYLVYAKLMKLNAIPDLELLMFGNLLHLILKAPFLSRFLSFLDKNYRDKIIKIRNIMATSDFCYKYDIAVRYFFDDEITNLGLNPDISLYSLYKRNCSNILCKEDIMMLFDLKFYLVEDILTKVDRATMYNGLESREPFLDYKLLELSMAISPELKYKNGVTKYLLKKILEKYLPQEIVYRKKKGFAVPLYEWFKTDLSKLYEKYLGFKELKKDGILNPAYVRDLLEAYKKNAGINYAKIWLLFIFQLWKERWL